MADELKGQLGCCMTRALKCVRQHIASKKRDLPFQSDILTRLLDHNPCKKVKDVLYFSTKRMPPYYRYCLTATRRNQTVEMVSWQKCVRKLYGKYDKEANARKRAIHAFREEISCSPKMCAAREAVAGQRCKGCDKKAKLAVDHDEIPFAQILDEFLEQEQRKLSETILDYTSKPHLLKSRALASKWVKWHDERAVLIGLCRTCNSSKGSGGYRHKV